MEAQSEKAKEYLSYRDELRNLDINVFLQDYKENSASMEELREKEVLQMEIWLRQRKNMKRSRQNIFN